MYLIDNIANRLPGGVWVFFLSIRESARPGLSLEAFFMPGGYYE